MQPDDKCAVPSAQRRRKIEDAAKWLWANRDTYLSRDPAQKQLYLERLSWLKENGWWHYRILRRNLTYYSTFVIDGSGWLLRGKLLREYRGGGHPDVGVKAAELPPTVALTFESRNENRNMNQEKHSPGGDNEMPAPEWNDVEKSETIIELGYGGYLRLVERSNGKSKGLMFEKGEFQRTPDGGCDKSRLSSRNRMFLPLNGGAIQNVIKDLQRRVEQ